MGGNDEERSPRGLNMRWLMDNADEERNPRMPRRNVDMAAVLDRSQGQVTRLLKGRNRPPDDLVRQFVDRTNLAAQVPGIDVAWFNLECAAFAERMRLAGYGKWASVAGASSWIGSLPPLPEGRFVPEAELRRSLRPSAYRSDFGAASEDEAVVAVAEITARYGIAVEELPDALTAAVEARTASAALLHRPIHERHYQLVPLDPRSTLHLVEAADAEVPGAAAPRTSARALVVAKQERVLAYTRFGFEVGGVTGRRELVLFVFGNFSDLPEGWRAERSQATLSVEEIEILRAAAERGTARGDALAGRLLFDAVPPCKPVGAGP